MKVDLIPLSLGGGDVRDLLPESWDTQPWNAARKEELEVVDFVVAGASIYAYSR